MAWRIELSSSAEKSLSKLDCQTAKRIITFPRERVAAGEDPRASGKPLSGPLAGRWRYRVGDYRIVCEIEDGRLVVLVLTVGHRSGIYRCPPKDIHNP
ncbi:type II toxin-antitoxin system RelE/ParE family toxin (plasmid) [Novosphingobium resinovorum]|uniref:type II toxin-antitoxin system RelE family toxin n=1 Tax=Novosphingobium resinovorum TaxID=158500 RepID=UPI001B3C7AA2|nr:type II toxin-antitoxin system RelE/ParE family toxin [Novosphingobium resinovorum]MBF7015429.1 type II toxin-antitoxin system RelE/ParE family toxin [Novosphingobium sp. HR1a]WJM30108.1 type II toxin-antitoxin system RelE/ParE family toxin [Novosphingobium resinovorum]